MACLSVVVGMLQDLAGMTAVLSRLMDCLSVPDQLVRCQADEEDDDKVEADGEQHEKDDLQQEGLPRDEEEVLRHLYEDLYVQEKKISKSAAQLASLRCLDLQLCFPSGPSMCAALSIWFVCLVTVVPGSCTRACRPSAWRPRSPSMRCVRHATASSLLCEATWAAGYRH